MLRTDRITTQHLLHLEALVQERHVTRAAERIGIGQPAMSSSLAKLRRVLRDPLLVKTSRGMEPTPRALELVRKVRDVVDLLEGRVEKEGNFDLRTARSSFRIMASDGIARVLAPELMRIAEKAAPEMRFTISPGDVRRTADYLRDGDFDLAVAFLRRPPNELHQTQLYPQKLVCIARRGHPSVTDKMSLKQFLGQPHAVWGAAPVPYPTMETMIDEALAVRGYVRRVVLRVSSVLLLTYVIARSDLLAVIPEPLALTSSKTMPIEVFSLPFGVESIGVSMLWHDRLHRNPAHRWLRTSLRTIGRRIANAM
jgi:DNA-binding transcriptional LysR family regulator